MNEMNEKNEMNEINEKNEMNKIKYVIIISKSLIRYWSVDLLS